MASKNAPLSRKMRVGILGSVSAVGGYAASQVAEDEYWGTTIGGAAAAAVTNLLFFRFQGIGSVMMLGAIASYSGNRIARALTPDDADDVPFRTLLGLSGGGGLAALSMDSILPPEIKLLEP